MDNKEFDKVVDALEAQLRPCPDCGKQCFDWCCVCEKSMPTKD